MRTLVINLDRHPGRMAMMAGQLDKLKLPYERLTAIDRRGLAASQLAGIYLSPGEIACHLSHRKAWQRLVNSGDETALILEDDVVLSPLLAEVLATPGWIPRDALAIKIECHFQDIVVSRAEREAPGALALARLRSLHYGSAGYIITRRFAERLIAARAEKFWAVDACLFGPRRQVKFGGMVYQMRPALCAQVHHFLQPSAPLVECYASDIQAMRAVHNRKDYPVPIVQIFMREIDRVGGDLFNFFAYPRDRISGGRVTICARDVAGITPDDVAMMLTGEKP
jgi:glycosyl transferase family 25